MAFLVSCAFAWAVSVEAHPFLRDYVVALDDLRIDGDLRLAVPLCVWRLDEETFIDVVLDHQQEPLEYGEVRSRMDLLPFQTCVFPQRPGVWRWQRPGGGQVVFDSRRGTPKASRPLLSAIKRERGRLPDAPFAWYAEGTMWLAVEPSERWQAIVDDGWVLVYEGGVLRSITTPQGRYLQATCSGRHITAIHEDGRQRVRVEWTAAGAPSSLWVDGEQSRFRVSPSELVESVEDESGATLAEFDYHASLGLIEFASMASEPARCFKWKRNANYGHGDVDQRKPYSLIAAGVVRYSFDSNRGVIRLERIEETTGVVKRLRIGMRYGKILWISGSSR